ncbi:hypothetical protein ACF1HJ_05655 [Streptomyces sp. NPDC013978]|uniref:hypothetical protein n=1 Tax=Streptomyces sp. NPDC013978 TaxID=3364869 RepID=UPI0036F6E26C
MTDKPVRTAGGTARSSGRPGQAANRATQEVDEVAGTVEDTRGTGSESDAARRRRRAQFLRELTEARELRDRVQPRRAKAARLRHAMRMRTFRW